MDQPTKGSSLPQKHVTLNAVSTFARPVSAEYRGEPIRVSAVGDVDGMSSSYLAHDKNGHSGWVPQEQVRITDPDFLPEGSQPLSSSTGGKTPVTAGA